MKKKGVFAVIVSIILIVLSCLPLIALYAPKLGPNKDDDSESSSHIVLTIDYVNIAWGEDTTFLSLESGIIKTNEQVDRIFANVNGYGVCDLPFTASAISTEDEHCIAHYLKPNDCCLSVAFFDDVIVTVDVYVEYANRTYKVDTQDVAIDSGWIGPY